MLFWITGTVAAIVIMFVVLTNISRRTNHRTPGGVADFIENFLEGKGDGWDWDEFITRPINDPALDQIRIRCIDIHNVHPPGPGEAYCNADGVNEMREIIDRLRAMQGDEDDLFDPEKVAFLRFDEPQPEHFAAIEKQLLALPVVGPSDPDVNLMIRGSRRLKLDANSIAKSLQQLISDDFARYYRTREPDETHIQIRYAAYRRGHKPDGVCIATILYSPGQPGGIIYAESQVERIADDIWLLYDNHTDAD